MKVRNVIKVKKKGIENLESSFIEKFKIIISFQGKFPLLSLLLVRKVRSAVA